MSSSMASSPSFLLLLTIIASSSAVLASAQNSTIYFPSNSSLKWTNSNLTTYEFPDNLAFRAILLTGSDPSTYGAHSSSIGFAFGFYCNRRYGNACLLSVIILDMTEGIVVRLVRSPEVVWHANRQHPARGNATLRAEPGRGLVLTDSGVEAWSTNITKDAPVSAMTLRSNGDLALLGGNGSTLWHSFLHPSNVLVMGQELKRGTKLRSSTDITDARLGRFSLSVMSSGLTAFEGSKSPLAYIRFHPGENATKNAELKSVIYNYNNLTFIYKKGTKVHKMIKQISPVNLLRLDWDGGVRYRVWDPAVGWSKSTDFTLEHYSNCRIPMFCGEYGVCTRRECRCPAASNGSDYFQPNDPRMPSRGCAFVDATTVPNLTTHQLVDFGNLSYFSYADPSAAIANITDIGRCRKACEGDSSCKAVFFTYRRNTSDGLCYLPSEVLTIRDQTITGDLNSLASIKVPIPSASSAASLPASPPPLPAQAVPITDDDDSKLLAIGKALAAAVVSVLVFALVLWFVLRKIKQGRCRVQDGFELVLGAPMRFSYKDLSAATGKFSTRLGRGGFGTVFKGELKDGTPIAVKRLDCIEQGTGEFLAEMKTMGSIHHYNLVKLIGFCADESNRLLVYEYMSNGSLDKWIFNGKGKQTLTWETIRRIMLDVARGLAYLHEECSQRIAHLDMKPHNILLDDGFNAKISDFGLARFIDRNHSQVVTGMRGTLGYLAPEWQNSRITVKADTYSFGVVILEAVSGRMNLDYSEEDLNVHLLRVLQRKAREDRLIDIVDKKILDWESHEEDIVNMIRIGAWCLNEDQAKRPSMSTVVKVLEGTMEMEKNIDFKFAHVLIVSSPSSTTTECSSESSSSQML